jgi:hypothetical protein
MWEWIKDGLYKNMLLAIPLMVALCLLIPLGEEILTGLANPWRALPAPPSRPVELLGTGSALGHGIQVVEGPDSQGYVQGDVYILAEDGLVYNFEEKDQSWRKGLAEHVAQREACTSTGPLLDRKQGECVQGREINGPYHRFLLDEQGVIWHWVDSPPLFPSYLFCGLTGLVCGLVLTLALVISRRREAIRLSQV